MGVPFDEGVDESGQRYAEVLEGLADLLDANSGDVADDFVGHGAAKEQMSPLSRVWKNHEASIRGRDDKAGVFNVGATGVSLGDVGTQHSKAPSASASTPMHGPKRGGPPLSACTPMYASNVDGASQDLWAPRSEQLTPSMKAPASPVLGHECIYPDCRHRHHSVDIQECSRCK